jgi:serine-aspartate repeat-containing protein C/D/E
VGISKFHISCSDSSMNGAEDCEKYLGNGKDDDPSLIDAWLLEGMKGDGGELKCSGI